MGTKAHLVVVGGRGALADDAVARLAELERMWSRFLPDSEISKCNALSGRAVSVSAETVQIVERAVTGWKATNGIFDPTILTALCDAGYDRDFRAAVRRAPGYRPPQTRSSPGCAGIAWDVDARTVTFPPGLSFDPGGIGKGLAADIVTEELLAAGAAGALVSVGGDVRVRGEAPDGPTWTIAIDDASRAGAELFRIGLHDGAVATSSRLQRAWQTRAGAAHHLIDPRTGKPAETPLVAVSAVAAEGWWAEIVAKAVLIGGLTVDSGEGLAARLVTVGDDGSVRCDEQIGALVA
jgi:thiamine biosynthesis lipoprotein